MGPSPTGYQPLWGTRVSACQPGQQIRQKRFIPCPQFRYTQSWRGRNAQWGRRFRLPTRTADSAETFYPMSAIPVHPNLAWPQCPVGQAFPPANPDSSFGRNVFNPSLQFTIATTTLDPRAPNNPTALDVGNQQIGGATGTRI
jgi:hypothetical protein